MDFDYNRDKNEWLKANRKVSFEDALVPYVLDLNRNVKFLKTIYASRKLKKLYENKQK